MIEYDYAMFEKDAAMLADACRGYAPDTIVAVARGGLMPAQFLAYQLDVRHVDVLRCESYDGSIQRKDVQIRGECDVRHSSRILVVDDIIDSGKTARAIDAYLKILNPGAQVRWATLWFKPTASRRPEYFCNETDEWIDFFWERCDG